MYVPAVEGPAAVSSAVDGPPAIPSQVADEPAVEGPAAVASADEEATSVSAGKVPPVMLLSIEGHSAVSPPAERETPADGMVQSASLSLSPATHAGTPASTASSFKDILSTPKIVQKVNVRKSTNKRALVLCQEDVKQAPPGKKGKCSTKQQSRKTKSGSRKKTEPSQKTKTAKGGKVKQPATADKSVDKTPCSSCGRLYNDVDFADFEWRQCLTCSRWFHEICDELCYSTGICAACQKCRRRRGELVVLDDE